MSFSYDDAVFFGSCNVQNKAENADFQNAVSSAFLSTHNFYYQIANIFCNAVTLLLLTGRYHQARGGTI